MRASNWALDFRPRPPETTRVAVPRSGREEVCRSSETQVVGQGALGSSPGEMVALLEARGAAGKAVPRIVSILMGSEDWRVRIALPAYMGRTKAFRRSGISETGGAGVMEMSGTYCLRF